MAKRIRIDIPKEKLWCEYSDGDDNEEILKQLTKYLEEHSIEVKQGDVIELICESGYRNTGVFLYDGEKVINLYAEVDDYGSVPPEMKILDFKAPAEKFFEPKHWLGEIDHNSIVWFDTEPYREQLIASISYEQKVNPNGEQQFIFYTWCTLPNDQTLALEAKMSDCSLETRKLSANSVALLTEYAQKKVLGQNQIDQVFEADTEESILEPLGEFDYVLMMQLPSVNLCPVCGQEENGMTGIASHLLYQCANNHQWTKID